MAGDMMGGVYDTFRGYGDSIGTFFSRGNSTAEYRTIGAEEEAIMRGNGWAGTGAGTQKNTSFGSMFAAAGAKAASEVTTAKIDLAGGLVTQGNHKVTAERTGVLAAEDPSRFEQEWLARLSKFAKLQEYVEKSEAKLK